MQRSCQGYKLTHQLWKSTLGMPLHGISLSVRKQILKCYCTSSCHTRGQESIICIVYFTQEEFTYFILWSRHLFKTVCSFSDDSCAIPKLIFNMVLMYEVDFYCKVPNFYRKNQQNYWRWETCQGQWQIINPLAYYSAVGNNSTARTVSAFPLQSFLSYYNSTLM